MNLSGSLRNKGLLTCLVVFVAFSQAQPVVDETTRRLPEPSDRPILEIKGNIGITSDGSSALLSYAQLKTFPQHTIIAEWPWFDSPREHSGPLLKDVLEFLEADGTTFKVDALNDYTETIPVSDIKELPIVLGIDKEGAPIRIRDKGPIFITYPFAERPDLRTAEIRRRSVWMVKTITVQ